MSNKELVVENIILETERKKIIRWGLLASIWIFSAIAITIDPSAYNQEENVEGFFQIITMLRNELGTVEFAHVLAFGSIVVLYDKELFRTDKPFCMTAFIIGGILSVFLLIGMSFSAFNNFDFIFGRKCQIIIAGMVLIGLWGILYTLLKKFYSKLDFLRRKEYSYKGIIKWTDDHFFFVCIGTMLICWIVLGITYFPGSVPHDGRNQLNMVFGFAEWKIHHPFFSTVILKIVYGLGYKLFGTTGGCVFYVGFQSIIASIVFAMICDYIRIKTKNIIPALVCVTYFSIAPMWWTFMQAVMKDALYFLAFALFSLEYVKVFLNDAIKRDWYILFVSSIAVCILRNGSILITFPALLMLFLIADKKKKTVAFLSLGVMIISISLNIIVGDVLGLTAVNQVESLSIPLQQIARYVSVCEEELTEKEKAIIDNVVEYDGISERYNPELSDPVKNRYKNTTKEQWGEFWHLWVEKFLERPEIYITATMNHVYGYIDPFYFFSDLTTYQLYNNEPLRENDVDMSYSEYIFSDELRTASADLAYVWHKIPIISFIVNPAFYTWIGIIMIGALLRKREWQSFLLFIVPLMSLLICFASPVNGYLRYSAPVMASIPVWILISILPYMKKCDE